MTIPPIPSQLTLEIVTPDHAVAHAEASPLPAPRDALTDLFAYYPWSG